MRKYSNKIYSIIHICALIGLPGMSFSVQARSVFLNGQDISSARQQNIKGANVSIDAEGNVFLEAPHYRVQEEKTYMPLSTWIKDKNIPSHKQPSQHPIEALKATPPKEVLASPAGSPNNLKSPTSAQGRDDSEDGFQPQNLEPAPSMNDKEGSKNIK